MSIDMAFADTISTGRIPGAVVAASSTDGSYKYAKAFGVRSLKEGEGVQTLDLDAVLWLGSCTKLMTAIAALQCVEKGQFTIDEDVTRLLPELKEIEVQVPSKDGEGPPTLVRAKNKITLRHLLTHTSGLSYTKFGQLHLSLIERCLAPLNFEPGEGFFYGTGTDFAGLMVERVTGLTLEKYIQQHIGSPLGIDSICFSPPQYPELHQRLMDVSLRSDRSAPAEYTPKTIWPLDMPDQSGGSGAYATIPDYQKIIHSITADDGVLLTSAMVDELFRPEMRDVVRRDVKAVLARDEITNNIYGGLPRATDVTYAMGGMVCLEDLPGRRSRGTVHWGGLLNVFFWMDRKNGLSGMYGSQVFPAGDPSCLAMLAEFERQTYAAYLSQKTEGE